MRQTIFSNLLAHSINQAKTKETTPKGHYWKNYCPKCCQNCPGCNVCSLLDCSPKIKAFFDQKKTNTVLLSKIKKINI